MTKVLPIELLVATSNKGKIAEFRSLLDSPRFRSLDDFPDVASVDETGTTFTENAVLKARGYALQTRHWTLADDSGLEVDALDGAPGVHSARYGGEGLSDGERVQRLLDALLQCRQSDRSARFVCVIAIADATGEVVNLSTGMCEGTIAHAPSGNRGFGYDPIFIPNGFDQSFGELPTETKDKISHRGRALVAAQPFLVNLFSGS